MLQDSVQGGVKLKQLDQAVPVDLSGSSNVDRQLPVLQEVTPRTIEKEEKVPAATFLYRRQEHKDLVPVMPLPATGVVGRVAEKPVLMLPERTLVRSSTDWQVGVFVFALILLVLVRLGFTHYLQRLTVATVNFGTAAKMFRERSLNLIHAAIQMDVLFYMTGSLFFYQALQVFTIPVYADGFPEYLLIMAVLTGFFLLKKIAYYLQANICLSLPETKEYLFNMNVYNRVLTLLLLPVCMILAFSPLKNPEAVVFFGLFVFVLFYIMLLLRGIKILIRKQFSIFYMILYLCTLEILPLLYIYKLVVG